MILTILGNFFLRGLCFESSTDRNIVNTYAHYVPTANSEYRRKVDRVCATLNVVTLGEPCETSRIIMRRVAHLCDARSLVEERGL